MWFNLAGVVFRNGKNFYGAEIYDRVQSENSIPAIPILDKNRYMKPRIYISTWALAGLMASLSQTGLAATAQGTVYHDNNRNGLLDRREDGILGVAVSNGREVTRTDNQGRYRIAAMEGDTIFITKPRNYALPVNEYMLPRYYYHYTPAGSPADLDLRYPGLRKSGQLPQTIDFPLYQQTEAENFAVIWTSDPQPRTGEELGFVRDDVITELLGVDAAFGITTGDILFDDLSLFPRLAAIYARIGIPWFNVAGNHDVNYQALADPQALETYRRNFGPAYYSFNWGQTHFVLLDSVHYAGKDPNQLAGAGTYAGRIDQDQLQWLAADLALVPKEVLVIVAMHIPFKVTGMDVPQFQIANRGEVLRLLSGFDHVFAVAGHLHGTQHVYFDASEGFTGAKPLHQHVLATIAGNWWLGDRDDRGIPFTTQTDGTPNGYHIMSVQGNTYSMRYQAAGKPATHQMRITLESYPLREVASQLVRSQLSSVQLLVNLFDGGPNSVLTYRIDDGASRTMVNELRQDPFAGRPIQGQGPARETKSSHIWSALLDPELAAGVHTIKVEAVDEYGQKHTGHKIIELLDDGLQ
ncbi:MAG: hypothetical protein HW386_1367 [Gammaproteobacteria bacterium]|nr:hypothetical protein [Gammaproteobacteria bacterium]